MARSLRTESRSIRPFAGLGRIDELFQLTRLIVDDQEFKQGTAIIPEMDYKDANYKLSLGFDAKNLKRMIEDANIPFVDTALVCIAKSRMLKTMHIQFLEPLRYENLEKQIEIDTEQNPLVYRDQTGFKLYLAVVLVRNLPKKALRPNLTGTWLGQARFSVAPETVNFQFSPTRLTDAVRTSEDLPKQTLSYVKIKNEDAEILYEEDFERITTSYLDEDVLSLVQSDESDPLSDQITRNLVHQTIYQLLLEITQSLSGKHERVDFGDLVEGSAAKKLVSLVATQLEMNPNRLLEIMKERPSFASALLEGLFAMRKTAIAGLRAGDSA
jgi:hypothetical protein